MRIRFNTRTTLDKIVFFRKPFITWSAKYLGEILAELMMIAVEPVEKFKGIVLAKHGKLKLSVKGRRSTEAVYQEIRDFWIAWFRQRETL